MKIHFKASGYWSECGFSDVVMTTNPTEVTCKSCMKTIKWKKAMGKIVIEKEKEVSMKTNWIVETEKEIKICIQKDSICNILYNEVQIIKELSPSKFVLYDSEDREFYLLTLTLHNLTGGWVE